VLGGAGQSVAHVVPAWRRPTRGESRMPYGLAVIAVTVLQLLLPSRLTIIDRWVVPAAQLLLVVVLTAANRRVDGTTKVLRGLSLLLILLASITNAFSVGLLVRGLVNGTEPENAASLLANGANIWVTNVIIFGLWYWELDRGGPAARAAGTDPYPDLLFPQMTLPPEMTRKDWEPRFLDYFYVAFTNATAFSPTDTLPLSRGAKAGMALQAAISLVTAALVVARAVNIFR
jgi:hypothetical protein